MKKEIPADYLPPRELWPDEPIPDEFKDLPAQVNIAEEFLDKHVKEGRGDNVAILFGDQKVTYNELLKLANKFANILKDQGVMAQDRVGIRMTNTPQAVAINFGIQKVGAIPVPVSPLWAKEEIAFTLNNAEFAAFAVSAPLMTAVEEGQHEFQFPTKIIVVGGKPEDVKAKGYLCFEELMAQAPDTFDNFKLNLDDIGVILYTSGTTGQPKGCVHFVREVIVESNLVNKYVYKLKPGEVLGGSAPVSFAAGYGTFCLIPFAAGATISLLPKFTPDDMMSTIQKHKVNVVTGLPTAYRKLLEMPNFDDYDRSSVRMYTTGGDALTGKTLAAWEAKTGMPIWEGLGATEMVHLVTSNTMSKFPVPDSIGKALPGYEIKVVNVDGHECAPGEVGSMLVKGPTGTVYWKPYIQENKLLKTMKKGVKDGYNMMGDAVYMDKDGFVYFQAREDDMIKSSGFRLAPTEIEDALIRHPAVRDAGVVGIPDEIIGQRTTAMVELEPGYKPSEELAKEIVNSCIDVLAKYKLPREVVFLEAIPRTPTGKMIKKDMRRLYDEYPNKFRLA
ncbi:MAG: acyl-CoA synthetase [Deltaproteobacteria bacterium]|nr:acyl-CoA synthetase [Deltaproteobacteria bacterium]MBW1953608.1 acyl-CoA synthetase [Deltaproteobacteria bacterium]MBW1987625.1 acyl-CoA synthetase [Deltaproteobacteria bacterium]MBW2135671.1 acyl-CoA synthetase [Deltaproteobacteria bacterium]